MRAAMWENFLPKALFLSLTIHTAFIGSSFLVHMPHQKKAMARDRQVEITYRPQSGSKAVDMREHPVKPIQRLDLRDDLLPQNGTIPMKLGRNQTALANNLIMSKPKPVPLRSGAFAHRVMITPIHSAKINDPAYAAYMQRVRGLIEERAYENYTRMEAGDVYLTFVITSDGTLKAFQIMDEKSQASQNLKDASIKSLQESQFPPVFKGMSLPEYTFNIEIQYQVRE